MSVFKLTEKLKDTISRIQFDIVEEKRDPSTRDNGRKLKPTERVLPVSRRRRLSRPIEVWSFRLVRKRRNIKGIIARATIRWRETAAAALDDED